MLVSDKLWTENRTVLNIDQAKIVSKWRAVANEGECLLCPLLAPYPKFFFFWRVVILAVEFEGEEVSQKPG